MSVGFFLETWGGGRYTVIAFYPTWEAADKERERRFKAGLWKGKPPRVVPAGR